MGSRKVAVIVSGIVGEVLANGFLKKGHAVTRGTREPAKLDDWRKNAGERASVGTFAEAAGAGDVAVIAAKGNAAESVVRLCGLESLAGKTVIDTMNPMHQSMQRGSMARAARRI